MNKLKLYFQDTWDELLNKVSWPTWAELQNSALIVMIASLIIAMMVFAMDKASSFTLTTYYNLFG